MRVKSLTPKRMVSADRDCAAGLCRPLPAEYNHHRRAITTPQQEETLNIPDQSSLRFDVTCIRFHDESIAQGQESRGRYALLESDILIRVAETAVSVSGSPGSFTVVEDGDVAASRNSELTLLIQNLPSQVMTGRCEADLIANGRCCQGRVVVGATAKDCTVPVLLIDLLEPMSEASM